MTAAGVRLTVAGGGVARVDTGLPLLDHLLGLLVRAGSLDLALELAPDDAEAEIAAAGAGIGEALAEPLRAAGAPGHGSAAVPADEALAFVVLEVSERPSVHSNVDLTTAHAAGLRSDLVARFLAALTEGAGLTVHVRLLEGEDTQHVLEAIFKALGAALAAACRPRP